MESASDEVFVVYLYCDYRKEVDVQHLKVFATRDKAIDFAKKYSSEETSEAEYVCITGTEYDAAFYDPGDASSSDEETSETEEKSSPTESRNKKYKRLKEELKIKPGMWYTRIGVDKVKFEK